MNIFVRAAIAAVLVVGVGLVAINVLPRGSDGPAVGGQHTASPSPSASAPRSPAQSAAVPPELTQTFVSPTNGFSIGYSDDAAIEPATAVSNQNVAQNNAEFDFIHSDTFGVFRGMSTEPPDGVSMDDWIDRSFVSEGCSVIRNEQPEITIDGQPGRIWEGCPNEIEATVVVGQRLYLFTLASDASNDREIFDAWASTIDLRPEEAASPGP